MYRQNEFMIRHDRFRVPGGTFEFGRFGAAIATGTINTSFSSANTFRVGASERVANSGLFTGDIAEIVAYNRRLSDLETGQVNDYLRQKYFLGGTSGIPLYIASIASRQSGIPLYTSGAYFISSHPTLYTAASFSQHTTSLFEHGLISASGGKTLFTQSATRVSGLRPLYTHGYSSATYGPFTLFTTSIPPTGAAAYRPLFVQGPTTLGTSGFYRSMPLFLNAGRLRNSMTLFAKGPPIDYNPSSVLTLFTSGPVTSGMTDKYTTLFLENAYTITEKTRKLFISGEGTLVGGQTAVGSLYLYLDRPASMAMSLFIGGSGSLARTLSLVTKGGITASGIRPLFISGTSTSSGIPLYIHGPNVCSGGRSLYVAGLPTEQQSMSVFTRGF